MHACAPLRTDAHRVNAVHVRTATRRASPASGAVPPYWGAHRYGVVVVIEGYTYPSQRVCASGEPLCRVLERR
jgi:hypothetical protein